MAIYTFVIRDGGDPTAATGLTPTFLQYIDISSLTDLIGSAPAISEIGNGHYKFSVDWDTAPESTAPTDSISIVIDAGVAITSPQERYVTARINRTDDFGSKVHTLYDIEMGKWEIVNDQFILYGSDNLTVLKTFDLFDLDGDPTSIAPAKRVPV